MCQWNDIFDLLFDTTTNNLPGVEREEGGFYDYFPHGSTHTQIYI